MAVLFLCMSAPYCPQGNRRKGESYCGAAAIDEQRRRIARRAIAVARRRIARWAIGAKVSRIAA